MPPDPDQVHVEHRVAAAVVGEEVEAEVTVEHQRAKLDGQHREGGEHDQRLDASEVQQNTGIRR